MEWHGAPIPKSATGGFTMSISFSNCFLTSWPSILYPLVVGSSGHDVSLWFCRKPMNLQRPLKNTLQNYWRFLQHQQIQLNCSKNYPSNSRMLAQKKHFCPRRCVLFSQRFFLGCLACVPWFPFPTPLNKSTSQGRTGHTWMLLEGAWIKNSSE